MFGATERGEKCVQVDQFTQGWVENGQTPTSEVALQRNATNWDILEMGACARNFERVQEDFIGPYILSIVQSAVEQSQGEGDIHI